MNTESQSAYDAFVSYKHMNERSFAEDLELDLKRYSRGPLSKPRRIFRDEQHLQLGRDLPLMIKSALRQSKFLVLLASPEAASSPWVRDEVDIWCGEFARTDNLIIVLTDGKIAVKNNKIDWQGTNALPPNLERYLERLPLWVDLCDARDPVYRALNNPSYKSAVNAIVARLEDIEPNELLGEEWRLQRRNRTIAIAAAASLALLLVISVLTSVQLAGRNQQLTEALSIALSRELGASARLTSAPKSLELSAKAAATAQTNEALRALRDTLSRYKALRGHQAKAPDAIESMTILPSGDILFTPSGSGGIAKISIDGKNLQQIDSPKNLKISEFRYASGRIIARVSEGIWLYEIGMQEWLPIVIPPDGCGEGWPASAISINAEGNAIAVGWPNGKLCHLNIETGKIAKITQHDGLVTSISSHGDKVFSTAATQTDPVRVTSLSTRDSQSFSGVDGAVNALAISSDGRRLALALEVGAVSVWSTTSVKQLWRSWIENSASSLAFADNGGALAVGDSAGSVYIFDENGALDDKFEAIVGGVWELEWQDKLLLSAGSDGWIRVWDPVTPGPVTTSLPDADLLSWIDGDTLFGFNTNSAWSLEGQNISQFEYPFGDVEFAANGVLLARFKSEIKLHVVEKTKKVSSYSFAYDAERFNARSFAVSPDGSIVAISLWPKDWEANKSEIQLWHWRERKVEKLHSDLRAPQAMVFSDAKRLAIASDDIVELWDITQIPRMTHGPYSMSTSPITSMAFIDDQNLALGNLLGFIEVRDLDRPETVVSRSEQVVGAVRHIEILRNFSANAKSEALIFTVDVSGVKEFDINLELRGALINTDNRQIGVRSIASNNAGNMLAAAMQGGIGVLVPISLETWIQRARNRANPYPFR